jgi:hypothetical protein
MNTVTLIVAMIIIAYLVVNLRTEGFETIAEKEKAHKDYFAGGGGDYEDYRTKVAGGNVVDYMKYKK